MIEYRGEWVAYQREVSRQCPLAHADLTSLWQTLDQHVPESRYIHGLRHRQFTVLTIVIALLLAGKNNEIPAARPLLDRLEFWTAPSP